MSKENSTFKDFQHLLHEVNRFILIMNEGRFSEISRHDSLFLINNSNGAGHTIIGRTGSQILNRIAKRALNTDEDIRYRACVQTVRKTIEWYFSDQILKSRKELTPALAKKIIAKSVKHVRDKKIKSVTHYIPCILALESDRTEFSIGPVRFQTTEAFFEKNKSKISEHTKSTETKFIKDEKSIALGKRSRLLPTKKNEWPLLEIKKSAIYFEESLREYFKSYRWVASTKTNRFDTATSKRVARASIETALNILRLFIGAYHADHFRLGGGFRDESRSVTLTEDQEGKLLISISSKSEDATLGKDWLNFVFSPESGQWVQIAGSLIHIMQSGTNVPLLYQRLIDALWWYGEAVCEPLPNVKVIRYANALEVFLGTSAQDISHQLALRASYLCSDDVLAEGTEWYDKVKRFYDARSRLVHGRLSPMDLEIDEYVALGEQLTSKVLMEGLSWTMYLAHQNHRMGEREIARHFEQHLPWFSFHMVASH